MKNKNYKKKLLTQNIQAIPEYKNLQDDEDWEYIYNFEERSRAFVPVQTGCHHFCSYCIISFTKGKFRSYSDIKNFNKKWV